MKQVGDRMSAGKTAFGGPMPPDATHRLNCVDTLVYRQSQICGLSKRRVADARRTERERIGSVKATLPEDQYRDR